MLEVPDGFMELKYQKDAVGQGYQMLKKYNGFFLADVVGLGKTVIATMIAKQFIEANGVRNSRILVVFPPALEYNWRDTFRRFKIERYADFISCGSLDKILEETGGYRSADEYDMVLVDEAHRFRSDNSNMYDSLQRICRTDRAFVGHVGDHRKKVMLISATPLNNRPDDLYNLLRLFQDQRKCNIDGIPNLQNYFAPKIAEYKEIMSRNYVGNDVAQRVDSIYDAIRSDVIDKVTVRRTRENIEKYAPYMEDLEKQGIKFPKIDKPRKVEYILPPDLKLLFEKTIVILAPDKDKGQMGLQYARYRAIEKLTGEYKERYINAEATSRSLATIYKTHMIKRLESSFYAFRKSLGNLRRATQGMVDMFAADKVIIAPDLKVKELQDKGMELDEIIERGIDKLGASKDDFVYKASAFEPEFLDSLNDDITLLDGLIAEWGEVMIDPKLDRFIEYLETKLFDRGENPTGKLVVFSESKDTISYLSDQLEKRLGRKDIMSVSSEDRKGQFTRIQANFDANFSGIRKDDVNIIIATDVLAEGVNLHRANVIVNYDTPWNASRLMQRIGRVNRIGSVAGVIVNYMFYPSAEGDAQIRLYKNALAKLQGFHSALGEDSQIFSREEIVGQFELFNPKLGDYEDKIRLLLDEARKLYAGDPEAYERIKNLPVKSRTARNIAESGKDVKAGTTLVYISSSFKQEFYKVNNGVVTDIGFIEAVGLFQAKPEEKPYEIPSSHFKDVAAGQSKFDTDVTRMLDDSMPSPTDKDNYTEKAKWLLWEIKRRIPDVRTRHSCETLLKYVELGTYTRLSRDIARLERKYRIGEGKDKVKMTPEAIEAQLRALVVKYHNARKTYTKDSEDISTQIILSETFI